MPKPRRLLLSPGHLVTQRLARRVLGRQRAFSDRHVAGQRVELGLQGLPLAIHLPQALRAQGQFIGQRPLLRPQPGLAPAFPAQALLQARQPAAFLAGRTLLLARLIGQAAQFGIKRLLLPSSLA